MTNLKFTICSLCMSLLLAVANAANGQGPCPDGMCPVHRISQPPAPSPQSPLPHAAHCRILVADGSTGSGTLVDRNDKAGLVLSCSHLFDQATEGIVVAFPNGQQFAARLTDRDRAHDLSALVIQRPEIEPVTVDDTEVVATDVLTACGYGRDGRFRPMTGQVSGRAMPVGATYPSVKLSGAVRPGDSGGGVLDTRGRLVGVVWGQRDGETFASCGQPVRRFLDRVLGRSQHSQIARRPAESDWPAWRQKIESRITALERAEQNKDDYLRSEGLAGRIKPLQDHIQSLQQRTEKLAASKVGFLAGATIEHVLTGGLAISSPPAAVALLIALLSRRRRKEEPRNRRGGGPSGSPQTLPPGSQPVAVDTPPLPQRTVPETHYVPYENDAFAKAHQWASEQVARKYPGAVEMLSTLDSLIKQQLNAV